MFRGTAGTRSGTTPSAHWLASGIDLKTVQHWAGHATLALTLDTYGHLIPRADDHQRIAAAERALLAT